MRTVNDLHPLTLEYLNTNDPTLHQVTPTRAWLTMVRDFGFGLDDLRGFMHNGLVGAWIDDTQRRRWRREWSAQFDVLRAASHLA